MAQIFKTPPRRYFNILVILILICLFAIIVFDKSHTPLTNNKTVPTIAPTVSSLSLTPSPLITKTTETKFAQPGEHCGGFIRNAKQCTSGYHCKLGHIPDAGGICVAN